MKIWVVYSKAGGIVGAFASEQDADRAVASLNDGQRRYAGIGELSPDTFYRKTETTLQYSERVSV